MKGSIVITVFGIMVFLISSFFIFFAFDKLVSNELVCILKGAECEGKMSNTLTFGTYIIYAMLIMIVSAAYVMAKSISIDMQYRKRAESAMTSEPAENV